MPYVLGSVAYDPKVVTIWEGFKRLFEARGFAFDWVLYSNYERQVEALLAGHIDASWSSPLAWIEAERAARARGRAARAVCMRDTDRDLTSVIVVRADSPLKSVADLRGKRVAVGASDSPQATLIPLGHLIAGGLRPEQDFTLLRHEVHVGKHGDHVGGERDAAKALIAGRADAACLIDANHLAFQKDGTLATGATRVLAQTGRYDHCNVTVLDAPRVEEQRFVELLLAMRWDDPEARPLLELEGLKAWVPGRTSGYALLDAAVDALGTVDPWLRSLR